MVKRPVDTSPEVDALQIEGYRKMGPIGRLMRALDLSAATEALSLARIRAKYGPDLDPREERLRLASLWLDRETMVRLLDWDPEREGY